jgi:hypothetical protein
MLLLPVGQSLLRSICYLVQETLRVLSPGKHVLTPIYTTSAPAIPYFFPSLASTYLLFSSSLLSFNHFIRLLLLIDSFSLLILLLDLGLLPQLPSQETC